MRPSRSGSLPIAALVVVSIGFVAACSIPPEICNRHGAGSPPSVAFELPRAAEIRRHLPGFGSAPEVDAATGPITVVIFDGPHHAVPLFPALQQGVNQRDAQPLENVMCVVTAAGAEQFYTDVDLTRADLSGLVLDRVDSSLGSP